MTQHRLEKVYEVLILVESLLAIEDYWTIGGVIVSFFFYYVASEKLPILQ